ATRERKGNVDLYRYNIASPAARYLKIFFNLSELSDLLRKLRRVSDKVVLFGSYAEGTDSAESDVDLLVVTGQKEEVGRTLNRTRGPKDRKVSPMILTALEFSQLKAKDPGFYEQVSKGITLWQNGED